MEGFTIVDAGVGVIILLSAVLAYSRGFVREVLAIGGWVAAAIAAFVFAPQAQPLVQQIPVLDRFLGDSCELSMIASFAVVLALTLVVASIFIPLFASAVQRSALGGIDQALGFLFGALRGIVLVAVAFLVYERALAGSSIPVVDNARSAEIFQDFEARLNEQMPTDAPGWVVRKYEELVSSCAGADIPLAPAEPSDDTGTGAKTLTAPSSGG
ncbi:CvpA family protein [Albidovulum sp.]|uniref:CvpA family protein n=1 Tax=Albidovulum sp. TaxID=1872424 RepID=UPI001E03989B|nr:CvpA family protein [Paracoccaceae bacterium]MCC0046244.1 CvpA family protein [Defluviimonas sp.]HPE26438.1 CvpA family protein [Albidovulum sp.]MCB2120325.1 CvpA family protein [Paracoccaceae bacterium]MCB2123795.1 CvpA family protein [Paracoccaceae bacterium]